MSDRQRHRARLWLRSERAMGLTGVKRVAKRKAAHGGKIESESSAPTISVPAVPRQKVAAAPVDMTRQSPATAAAARASIAPQPLATVPSIISIPKPLLGATVDGPPLSREEKIRTLATMNETEVRCCTKCQLCKTRTQTVFGEGDPDARLFFIGEGPGENEDLTGRPFVGKAGQLLDKMIAAMGLAREQVYIANIVKCRPPGNRVPELVEVETCTPYLERQLEVIRPKVIVTLGLPATRYMLQCNGSMSSLRGRFHDWRGVALMPTFHPAYVLRSYTKETREKVWSDLQQVMSHLNLPTPETKNPKESA